MDCKVSVRRYVLIKQPSRWHRRGDRVVVQSPMLELSNNVSEVLVKRFNGLEQNEVCLIPKTDIEKDSTDIYEKSQVSRATFSVNAHGVALFQSTSHDDFQYKVGHRFWIAIDATYRCEDTVPVINLHTYQSGVVRIDQVCWYPKIRGPDGELWTLGGVARHLRLGGRTKLSTWSLVICQHLDGSQSMIKNVVIPTKDVAMADRSLLTLQESQALFERRYRCMLDGFENIDTGGSGMPPSPPASPDVQHAQKALEETLKIASSPTSVSTSINLPVWQRILAYAIQGQKRTRAPYVLRNSTIHTHRPQHQIDRTSAIPVDVVDSVDDDSSEDLISLSDTRSFTPSLAAVEDEQLSSKDAEIFDVDATMMNATPDISKWHKDNLSRHNHLLDNLCDAKVPNCPYITISTSKHFHPPPEKCRTRVPTVMWDYSFPDSDPEPRPPTHEHCVTRLGPYPATGGDCLLANSLKTPSHTCCVWHSRDLVGISIAPDHGFNNVKLDEARRKRLKIYDTSSRVKLQITAGFDVEDDEGEYLTEEAKAIEDQT
ncbi:uncharacterized protein LY89DRAFT_742918 [Mollisia scopiformis]|uniref:Uncharacterized protein n=1 Tax=Mollisia scopiformis TaxID=149040 RepID=A0A132B4E6_MOLSC|nr:uncharacterized protein LY89DRAFT_742918 [Mollisia scopiformis]KUJ07270.1 hypothetical protein LY89DRAFT_742918 [Mollisia scopiformis]